MTHKTNVGKAHPSYGKLSAFVDLALNYDKDECLEWPFSKNARGYGQITLNQQNREVHRIICERTHGPCPANKHHAAHQCGSRSCVNPNHLRWASRTENEEDKAAHGRRAQWEQNGKAKLTNADVLSIRTKTDQKQKDIAAEFGVSKATISMILRHRTWKNVTIILAGVAARLPELLHTLGLGR